MTIATQPSVVYRPDQPYVAIRGLVTMQAVSSIADRFPEVYGWLAAHGAEPAGPPFLRYHLIDMGRRLEIEAGVPVVAAMAGGGDIRAGVLPAGRYVSLTHVGHPAALLGVTKAMLAWADEHSLAWDVSRSDGVERWSCRLEIYKSDQDAALDQWETELAFKLA